jgi:biopolymer transport protein ExbD
MPIVVPGKRFGPRLAKSKIFGKGAHGKKSVFADLLITPLVDMFVIIVLFLIANFSATGEVLFMTKDIVLPDSAHGTDIEMKPVIQVSKTAILVQGEAVAQTDSLGKDEYWNIPALEEKLRDEKKRLEVLHEGDKEGGFKGEVNIQSDKEVPFSVIKRVMYSANQAGYFSLNFATMSGAASGNGATGDKPVTAAK